MRVLLIAVVSRHTADGRDVCSFSSTQPTLLTPSGRRPNRARSFCVERLAAYAVLKREGWGRRQRIYSRWSTCVRVEVRPQEILSHVPLCAATECPSARCTIRTEELLKACPRAANDIAPCPTNKIRLTSCFVCVSSRRIAFFQFGSRSTIFVARNVVSFVRCKAS